MKQKKKRSKSFKLPSTIALVGGGVTLLTVLLTPYGGMAQSNDGGTAKDDSKKEVAKAKSIEVDLDSASIVSMSSDLSRELKPISFTTKDNKEGWVVNIPGNRPIATPAYAEGMIFVGGGYGSHEFYAFDAETGALKWQYRTDDDGPTAAVVESGCAAFNTESCTVYVLNTQDGKLLWKEWLGDPLMSQPAIANGKLYMSYPTAGKNNHSFNHAGGQFNASLHTQNNSAGQGLNNGTNAGVADSKSAQTSQSPRTHALLCADLKTGKHLWEVPIPAEVITAPVIEGEDVYVSCHDGTSLCIGADSGKVAWEKKNNATSAPLIAAGKVINSERKNQGKIAFERLSIIAKGSASMLPDAWGGAEFIASSGWATSGVTGNKAVAKGQPSAALPPPPPVFTSFREAPFLESPGKSVVGMSQKQSEVMDSSVGFSTAPAAANLGGSFANLGVNTVAGGWAYQGSRAAHVYGDEAAFAAGGNEFYNFSHNNGKVNWTARAKGVGIDAGSQVFAPPSLGKKSMYLVTGQGHVLSIDKDNGKVNFMYAFKQPVTFQPALAQGNIYLGTNQGRLICLKTQNPDADGWTAWGGNARHNK